MEHVLTPEKRKAALDEFDDLVEQLDKIDKLCAVGAEADKIRDKLSSIWYEKFDAIAEIQADPLYMLDRVQIQDRKVLDDGGYARFLGTIYDMEHGVQDDLDTLVPWNRLDLMSPSLYKEAALAWGISRPQDIKFFEEYWLTRMIHDC